MRRLERFVATAVSVCSTPHPSRQRRETVCWKGDGAMSADFRLPSGVVVLCSVSWVAWWRPVDPAFSEQSSSTGIECRHSGLRDSWLGRAGSCCRWRFCRCRCCSARLGAEGSLCVLDGADRSVETGARLTRLGLDGCQAFLVEVQKSTSARAKQALMSSPFPMLSPHDVPRT